MTTNPTKPAARARYDFDWCLCGLDARRSGTYDAACRHDAMRQLHDDLAKSRKAFLRQWRGKNRLREEAIATSAVIARAQAELAELRALFGEVSP